MRILLKIYGKIFVVVVNIVWLMCDILYLLLNVIMIKRMKSRNKRIIMKL